MEFNFEQIKKELKEELTITSDTIIKKTIEIPLMYHKYLSIYSDLYKDFKKLSIQKDKIFGELYHHYQYNYEFKLNTVKEIESHINYDEKYILINSKLAEIENYLKFMEKSLENIRNASYSIKNFIDYSKLKYGEKN